MAGPLPSGFDPRKLAGMSPQMQMPVKLSIRQQLFKQIEIGERAKEALELLDNNPIIQNFLTKIE